MEHFRGTVSELWQKYATTEKFDEAFGVTYGAGLDYRVFDGFEPIVEPVSALEENGQLILKGHFPTQPDQLYFEQTYVYEGIGWKLYGFSFNIE